MFNGANQVCSPTLGGSWQTEFTANLKKMWKEEEKWW